MRISRFTLIMALCLLGASHGHRVMIAKVDRTVTLDVRGADVYSVVAMLAAQSNRNIVIDNTAVHHDPISLSVHDVSFETALHTVEMADGLQDYRAGGIIYIGTALSMNRMAPGTGSGVMTHVFTLSNADPNEIAQALGNALPAGTVIVPDMRSHSVIVTADATVSSRAKQLIAALDRPLSSTGYTGGVSQTFPLRYVRSSDALTELSRAMPTGLGATIVDASDQNALIVTGSADVLNIARQVLGNIDRESPQVLYEVRVVDLEPINNSSNVGISWGGVNLFGQPTQGTWSTFFGGKTYALNATLNALINAGHASVLATPTIAVLNNHEGSMLIGETRPITFVNAQTNALQVQYIDIGVQLRLTPTVGSDNYVTTDLHPEFSSFLGTGEAGIPIISKRQVDTTLRCKDGESIVIAGLLQDIISSNVTKVPFLSEIPVFGALFRNTTRSHTRDELVFVITPHIVRSGTLTPPPTLPEIQSSTGVIH